MGLCTVIIALGSMVAAGICGASARAQNFDRTQSSDVSLFGHDPTSHDRWSKLEASFQNIVGNGFSTSSQRLFSSSLSADTPFQLGRSQRFSFTTGGTPTSVGPMTWKRIYGMVGAYALHRGNYWGVAPALSLATGNGNTILQATTFAPSVRLRGRSFLSLGIRF